MPSSNEIRDAQRAAWAGLATGWDKWNAIIMDQLSPVGAAMIDSLDVQENQRHLDIASGTGEPGLTLAARAPAGLVVLTDLAAQMLAIAERRARGQGIENVRTAVCSADELPFADASFDSVSIRFGYMFLPDLARATAEFVRVLRPGGRLSASVWVRPDENPWTQIALHSIADEVELPPTDPDRPHMFRCAAPGLVSSLFEAAGLHEVSAWDVGVELATASPEQYWELVSDHVSPVVAALRQVDEPTRERIAGNVIAQARTYEHQGTVRIPGVARCVIGTR